MFITRFITFDAQRTMTSIRPGVAEDSSSFRYFFDFNYFEKHLIKERKKEKRRREAARREKTGTPRKKSKSYERGYEHLFH